MSLKHKLFLRFGSTIFLALIIAACSSSPTESIGSLKLQATTEMVSEIAGEALEAPLLRINITATNTTRAALSVRFSQSCGGVKNVVLYADSTYTEPTIVTPDLPIACRLILEAPTTIRSGETKTFIEYIVPPVSGKYYLRASFGIEEKVILFDAGSILVP